MMLTFVVSAVLLVGAVAAQYVVPSWPGFHTWQYAGLLGVLMAPQFGRLRGSRTVLFSCGSLFIGMAGLCSGLLGADSTTIAGAPGTVAPLPDLAAAAFFSSVDADAIARGDAVIILRRRNGESLAVERGKRLFLGSYALEQKVQPAAYVEVRDMQGKRLTVTQPTGASFLSPVLLFPGSVRIDGRTMPTDSFAAPAARRHVEAIFFSPKTEREGVLFVVHDDAGRQGPGEIALARPGQEVDVGGLRIRSASGSYPALCMSAVPPPLLMWAGSACLAIGAMWAVVVGRRAL
jgi:hypothetical protein